MNEILAFPFRSPGAPADRAVATRRLTTRTLGALAPVVLASVALWPVKAAAADGGLQTSIAVDVVGNAFARKEDSPATKLAVREAEVFFFAPIDPLFDGLLGLAAHQEGGKAVFELHEATIGSTKLIPWSRFRVGQFFLGVGKLNSTHRHDWPFTSAPRVHREFFGPEGADDTGVEYSLLPPLPEGFGGFTVDVTMGVTNGWKFGHSHVAGEEPKTPTHYSRISTFVGLPWEGGLQTGFNYLGRKDSQGTRTTLMGLDVTAKWRSGKSVPFFFQGELWHRSLRPEGVGGSKALGFYAFPQGNIMEGVHLGFRYDGYSVLTLEDALGREIANFTQTYAPTLTWKPSEFSTFRVSYAWELEKKQDKGGVSNAYIEAQTTFILGAHPAHEF